MRNRCVLACVVALLAVQAGADPWLMRSHDARRTGRSAVNGPRTGANVWAYVAAGGVVINIEPAVDARGVYFGTWGVIRRGDDADKQTWDKFDGRVYGLDPATGAALWEPVHPGRTPYAYRYDGREPGAQDIVAGRGLHLNYYNGTVEGTPCLDLDGRRAYVGRGDGHLYAIDTVRGRVQWVFRTHDPARADDPEGGGEVVGGALVTPGGAVVFATFAAPHRPDPPRVVRHETNAVYCVNRRGQMRWRYPAEGTLEQVFNAPVALSPDGRTVYAATALPEADGACELLALSVRTGELLWRLELAEWGAFDVAVGVDGVVYVAGMEQGPWGSTPIAAAVVDAGDRGEVAWGPVRVEGVRPDAHWAGGLALLEADGAVEAVYVSTSALRDLNTTGGELHRLDPATGAVVMSWDPSDAEPACVGGLTDVSLDAEGVVYVGVRGRWATLFGEAVPGRMYALRPGAEGFEVLWSHGVRGQIDWASPAIGPGGGLYFGSSDTLRGLGFIVPRREGEAVADADPVFYGVRD